ncbi:hypothetical protein N0B44_19775 [Roseibacterium beibuensis]|uniref:hypothetical protein n=1 Tax=[Roseibacterium] beibuensis TaxID=1193142 RepID=UPI00217E9BD6|nr:hypothetical protein [Roseibacterium beibuensis]MCS6625157.1 hypothetical protein [Roseibacterium beibuensis]
MNIGDLLGLLDSAVQQVFLLATLAVAAIGLAFGDRSVRIGVGLVLANFVLSGLVDHWVWFTIRAPVAVLDGALFGLLAVLALRSRRWWAHAAAAFALLGFFAHFIALVDQSIWWRAYVGLRWIFSAAVVGTLLVGVAETPLARGYERWAAQQG